MAGEMEDLENTLGYDPLPKRRAGKPRGRPPKKLVCKHGHPFEGDNVVHLSNGKRACRACKNSHGRKWKAKNPDYSRKYYVEKTIQARGAVKLRFHWDDEEGRVAGLDVARLMKTDWVIAADFLQDVIRLAQSCYDDVLKAKHADKGANQ
jgi:hypothetical protein